MPPLDPPTAPAWGEPWVRQARRGTLGLLTANVVSVAGGALSVLALPWFVLETTGSAVATGIAALCETLPIVVVSVFAGVIVDRLGAVATRVVSDAISAGTVLAVPALHATVGIELWQLDDADFASVDARLDPSVRSVLSVRGALEARSAVGGTAPSRVAEQLAATSSAATEHAAWATRD